MYVKQHTLEKTYLLFSYSYSKTIRFLCHMQCKNELYKPVLQVVTMIKSKKMKWKGQEE